MPHLTPLFYIREKQATFTLCHLARDHFTSLYNTVSPADVGNVVEPSHAAEDLKLRLNAVLKLNAVHADADGDR